VVPVAVVPIAMRRPDDVVRTVVDIDVIVDVRTVPGVGPVRNVRTIPVLRRLSQVGVLAIPGRALLPGRLPGATAERLPPTFCVDGRNDVFPGERGVL